MTKILITGVAGFLGSFLTERLLKEDYYVIGIDNLFRGKLSNIAGCVRNNHFEFYIHDIKKPLKMDWFRDVDVVFHYAAVNGTRHFYDHPLEVLETNVKGTINLLEASAKYEVEKFVFASSSEVYGEPERLPITEDNPLIIPQIDNPRHSYAASKMIGEMYVKWLSNERGLRYLIFRIFNTYGPRMDSSEYGQVIPEFIRKALLEPEFTIISPGTQTRSFCYVDDHVEMVLRAFEKISNQILNVGNDEEITVLDLARMIHEILGKKFEYKLLPPRKGDPMRRVPSIEKLVSLIGYRPKIPLRVGLEKTIEWYKKLWGLV